jgi:hypothetical protein
MTQLEFTTEELLQSHPVAEPLVAGGVRCHGGFGDDGRYISPRTLHRAPAIEAWEAQRAEQFGTPPLEVPLETWPEHYPNVAQSSYLLREGVRQPIIESLTRIGIVEGFGALIRDAPVPDLRALVDEDLTGTASLHLDKGLYEAHGRDEAGFDAEGGHKAMWFAARDVAFEHPPVKDETELMASRMAPAAQPDRRWPSDVDPELEALVGRMVRILLIEVQAFHTFAWAEALLADHDLVAGEGEAARLVSYIRSDETPHVGYLSVVLAELRDRTIIGEGGRRHAGTDLVRRIWDPAVATSLGAGRTLSVAQARDDVVRALDGNARAGDILEQFDALATPNPAEYRRPHETEASL